MNCNCCFLQPGFNFITVFMPSFYKCRSQKGKKLLDLTVFLALLGSVCVKAACEMMVKLTPEAKPSKLFLVGNTYKYFSIFCNKAWPYQG